MIPDSLLKTLPPISLADAIRDRIIQIGQTVKLIDPMSGKNECYNLEGIVERINYNEPNKGIYLQGRDMLCGIGWTVKILSQNGNEKEFIHPNPITEETIRRGWKENSRPKMVFIGSGPLQKVGNLGEKEVYITFGIDDQGEVWRLGLQKTSQEEGFSVYEPAWRKLNAPFLEGVSEVSHETCPQEESSDVV